MKLSGSLTALVTPFKNGALDEKAYEAFCDWQISEGTSGLVPCGTTGESPVLSEDEHQRVVSLAVRSAKKRVPVIAGAGSNNTAHAIHLAKISESAGADAILLVCPYYNKPTQEGLYQHFKAVAQATSLPLIIYNIPGRSAVDMSVETMKRLSQIKNIVGVKDATANLARVSEQCIACGKDFIQLSGEDGTAVAFNAQGGRGCISVVSNVAPRLCAEMQKSTQSGDYAKASDILLRLTPLIKALFIESSPGPVKYALSLLGKCSEDIRLPLVPPSASAKEQVKMAMVTAGLLN
jgi:4-hydroxy-tetrahydrodipicolinate synthase